MITIRPQSYLLTLLLLTLVGCGNCDEPSSGPDASPDLGVDQAPAEDLSTGVDASPDSGSDMTPVEDDVLPPIVMISSGMTIPPSGDYLLTGTAVDNVGITSLSYTINEMPPQSLSLDQGAFSATIPRLTSSTTLIVTATDAAGNQGMQIIVLSPDSPPELDATFTVEGMPWLHEPLIFDASEVMELTDLPLTFTWDFGDGTTASGQKLAHAFHDAETLTVSLTVSRSDGAADTATRDLTIVAPMAQGSALIEGHVTDEHGFTMPGVQIFHDDTLLGSTDIKGRYEVSLGRGIPSMLSFKKEGWNTQLQRVALSADTVSGSRDVSMRRVGQRLIVEDAAAAVNIVRNDGTRIILPELPFIYRRDAAPVTGQALIEITSITPVEGEVAGFPGSFSALRQGFIPTSLATHGAVEVTLSQGDEPLDLAPGVEATLDIPLGTDADVGQIIDLWSLDPRNGYWVWEGTGEVMISPENANVKVLRSTVSHFSVWNADEPIQRRSITLTLQGVELDEDVTDLTVKSTGVSDQGAVIAGTITTHQGLAAGPGVEQDIDFQIPVDYNTRIEIGSEQGCLYGFTDVVPTDILNSFTPSIYKANSPLNNDPKLEPGVPMTVSFTGARRVQALRFDEVPGQYWRLTVTPLTEDSRGHIGLLASCGGTNVTRFTFDERVGPSSFVIEPGPAEVRTLTVNPFGFGKEVQLLLEPITVPASDQDTSLGQRQTLTWADNSTEDRWVYMNAGQVAHVVLAEGAPAGAIVSFVTPSGATRAPIDTTFTRGSRIFTASESGWHLLVINPLTLPSTPVDYDLVIGEVFPERVLTFGPGSRESGQDVPVNSLNDGDIQRFKISKPGDHVLLAIPEADASMPSLLAPKLGGALPTALAPDDRFQSYALAEQTSNFNIEFFLYSPGLEPLSYRLIAEMIPRDQPVVRVGQLPCLDTDTTSVTLGAAALAEGGTLEVCGGATYDLFDGLNLRKKGIKIKGLIASTTPPELHAWPGDAIVRAGGRNLIGMSDLDIFLDDVGLELQLSDLDFGPYVLERLNITGSSSSSVPAIKLTSSPSIDWSQTPSPSRLDAIHLDVTHKQGLRVDSGDGFILNDVSVRGATERGILINNVAHATLTDLVIEDAVRALEVTGTQSRHTTLDGVTTSHGSPATSPTLNTSSILILDSPLATPSNATTLKNIEVSLGYEGQTAILLNQSGQHPSSFELEKILVDGQDLASTTAIKVQSSANGGSMSIFNSILKGITLSAIEVSSSQRFDLITMAHNTFQLGNVSGGARRDIIKLVGASATTFVKVFNTLFVGPQGATASIAGVNLYDATVSMPLGELRHNMFHQVTFPYARQQIAPFASVDASTDVIGDPLFINAMLEVDATSPAVDAGVMSSFILLDYLGVMRPQGAAPDIGAYEQ